jgi:[protein-PII] uridylyltransferase
LTGPTRSRLFPQFETADMVDLPMLRDAYRGHKLAVFDALRSAHAPARSVRGVLRQLATLADEALRALWIAANFGKRFALVAVGGF